MKKVSVRNCIISCLMELPIVLRIPISLARWEAWAVVRFIKLMQPNISKKPATAKSPYIVGLFAIRSL